MKKMIMDRRRAVSRLLLTALLAALVLGQAGCGTESVIYAEPPVELRDVSTADDGVASCLYDGTERHFILAAPQSEPVAGIIVMLHGYGSGGRAFADDTAAFRDKAVRRGYVLVYPDGVPDPDDPTAAAGWNSGIGASSVDDIGFLRSLALYLKDEYGVSREKVYAVGFSNGAFMTYRLAIEGSDCYAAVVSVAGMMPEKLWKERPKRNDIAVLQINGTKDDVVPMHLNGSAEHSGAPAIEDVMEYFAESMKLGEGITTELSSRAALTRHYMTSGDEDIKRRRQEVAYIYITDGRHNWPEEKYVGFDADKLILDFLGGAE